MSDISFRELSLPINKQIEKMGKSKFLYVVDIDTETLWNTYLDAFPEGANEIYKERREYDCNCCKNFIRNMGKVVSIENGQMNTAWNVGEVAYPFNVVAKVMHELILTCKIANVYFTSEHQFGNEKTRGIDKDENLAVFEHFFTKVPNISSDPRPATQQGALRSIYDVAKRSLNEIDPSSVDMVLELIDSDMLYRGSEHRRTVADFKRMLSDYSKLNSDDARDLFLWSNVGTYGINIRNTVIGSLLVDLTDGEDLETAVKKFESKVAPENYKRSKSLITDKMIKDALNKINELNLRPNLARRHATITDVSVNDVLFADRSVKPVMKDSLADALMGEVKPKQKPTDDKVSEIGIEDFIKTILPKTDSMEVFFENRHANNLASITAGAEESESKLFKWDSDFSWSYDGDLADSTIKKKVSAAGGNVDAKLRVSLSWFNTDDLDLWADDPSGETICYRSKRGKHGHLDVDMNVSNLVTDPVENIYWTNPLDGCYRISVDQYTQRNSHNVGMELEIEYDGQITNFSYPKIVQSKGQYIKFDISGNQIDFSNVNADMSYDQRSTNKWGLDTQKYVQVKTIMLSPNHWDEKTSGNKHYFFMLDGCLNPEPVRGIYNEYLRSDLSEHRKVFEVLGSKTKTEYSDQQLSGLGFSETKRNDVLIKTQGEINRIFKVKF